MIMTVGEEKGRRKRRRRVSKKEVEQKEKQQKKEEMEGGGETKEDKSNQITLMVVTILYSGSWKWCKQKRAFATPKVRNTQRKGFEKKINGQPRGQW